MSLLHVSRHATRSRPLSGNPTPYLDGGDGKLADRGDQGWAVRDAARERRVCPAPPINPPQRSMRPALISGRRAWPIAPSVPASGFPRRPDA